MPLITCAECGKQISDKGDSCPACGFPLEKTIVNASKKKQSILGVVGLILSMFMCWLPIVFLGFLLCLMSLRKKDKKQDCAQLGLAISVIALLIHVFFISEEQNTAEDKNLTPVAISNQQTSKDNIIDCKYNGLQLTYLRHEMTTNYIGEECIVVYYEFTNNSKETTSYAYNFDSQAFQNGVELEQSLYLLDDVEDNRYKDIKPGVSVEIYNLFIPSDDSVVELEINNFYSIKNQPLDSMNLLIN